MVIKNLLDKLRKSDILVKSRVNSNGEYSHKIIRGLVDPELTYFYIGTAEKIMKYFGKTKYVIRENL